MLSLEHKEKTTETNIPELALDSQNGEKNASTRVRNE